MPPNKIVCKFCKQPYEAFNSKRSHCSRPDCRDKAISESLKELHNLFSMLLRHKIVAEIEIRCPGNEGFGKQVKAITEGHLGQPGNRDVHPLPSWHVDELGMLTDYFRPILRKRIKGNFIIKTLDNGKLDRKVLNEGFAELAAPVILGNNLFVSQPMGAKS